MLILALFIQGCGLPRCQPDLEATPESLTAVEWRLVETTDSQVAPNLDMFNFLTMQFGTNLRGSVFRVVDNDKANDPILSFVYVADADNQIIRVQYTDPASGQQQGTYDYKYSLSRQGLVLRELSKGHLYYYVPLKGAVAPDARCEFNKPSE